MTQRIILDTDGRGTYPVRVDVVENGIGLKAHIEGSIFLPSIVVPVEQARALAHAILKEIGDE